MMSTVFATSFVVSFWTLWTVMVLGGLVYWLPTIIALVRRSASWPGIAVLNLFLGWSLIGWIGALIWALSSSSSYRRTSFV